MIIGLSKTQNGANETRFKIRDKMILYNRLLIVPCLIIHCTITPGPYRVHSADDDAREVFFSNHCYDCHDDVTAKGNLDLTSLSTDLSNPDALIQWTLVYDQVSSGAMPPKKKPRPPAKELENFLDDLGTEILNLTSKIESDRGIEKVRRMNRVEYENTLRDLLHIPLLQVKELLPEDGKEHGFAKVPTALDLSHVQMGKYLEASDKALRQAIVKNPNRPKTGTVRILASQNGQCSRSYRYSCSSATITWEIRPWSYDKSPGQPGEKTKAIPTALPNSRARRIR